MAPPRGSAAYKKKDGTLTLSKDGQTVAWTPVAPPRSQPALVLHVSKITSEDFELSFFGKSLLRVFRPSATATNQCKGNA